MLTDPRFETMAKRRDNIDELFATVRPVIKAMKTATLAERLTAVRKTQLPYLRPDGKTQVTIEYDGDVPVRVDTVVVSTQHTEQAWRDGARLDGWSEHFSYERWQHAAAAALADEPVDLDWYTTREREEDEVLPWDHLDSGLDRRWLWDDWQDALAEQEVEDCRWTPCFDCGVCDQLGTEIQVGPSGQVLLPMPAPATARDSR